MAEGVTWMTSGAQALLAPLARRWRLLLVAAALVFIALLSGLDYGAGGEINLAFIYLVPVAAVTWYVGPWPGVFVALVATGMWVLTDRLAEIDGRTNLALAWNAAALLGVHLAAVGVLAELRRTMAALRDALAREYALARVDLVTGVANARAFREAAEMEVARSARYGHPLTLAYLDADGFKSVNDVFGHSVGDRVLRTIAQAIAAHVRAADLAARVGGDEFAVLLPETDAEAAAVVLEKLRGAVAEATAPEHPLTVCIGAVTLLRVGDSVDALLQQADRLMYEAKHAGKNAVRSAVLAPEPGQPPPPDPALRRGIGAPP